MEYIKVTDALPDPNQKVWSYNGETEVKNIYDGERFKYDLKYPWTHWKPRGDVPDRKEVQQVRQQLTRKAI